MSTGIVTGPLADLALYVHELEQRAVTAERDLEQERQETGRLRARTAELEAVVRRGVSDFDGRLAGPGELLYAARVALGLDGRTGHRDVHAEVTA